MSTATSIAVKCRLAFAFALVLAFATLAAGPVLAAPGGPASAPARVSTEGISHEEYLQWQSELNRWLAGETPSAVYGAAVRVTFGRAEIDAIERAPRSESPMRIGLVKAFNPAIAVDSLSRGRSPKADLAGALRPTTDGGLVWAMLVRSDEAGAVRLHIEGMTLPTGAALYVYSPSGEAFGPYVGQGPDGSGDFWTTTVFGTEAILQVRVPATVDDEELRGLAFRVTETGIITANFAAGLRPQPGPEAPAPSFCGNPACIVDASCYSAANSIRDAYAKMEWIQGAYIYTCTGGLLNDTNPSQDNFFLTANHCLSKNSTAKNVTFYWRFRTSTCDGTCPSNSGWPYKSTGASVAASGRKGDFTLLHLNANPPSGSVFLGWTSAAVANTNGVALHRVSNPNFGPQVYNEQSVSTSAPTCSTWPRGERIYSRDTLGGTDGGSSGSPVVNASNQVVGQLSGACGTNVNDPCDTVNNATVDGAFAYYFATVKPFLQP